jgi:peptidoglycan glycosyltransferase
MRCTSMRALRAIGVAAMGSALALIVARERAHADEPHADPERPQPVAPARALLARGAVAPPFSGIELDKWALKDNDVVAPAPAGRSAHLAIDPALQRSIERILRGYKPPEAAAVVVDTASGRVKAWVSHVDRGPRRDLCTEASAPAASVFKIVTGAALVENASLSPNLRQCYAGGESRISAVDLLDNPKRDRWCATLGEAMGRSLNTVFARLALKHLTAADLGGMAESLGFGHPLPFDLAVAESEVHLPEERIGFARTAAGFWNTTLSPFEAASMVNTIANHGEVLRLVLVESVTDATGTLYRAPERLVVRRAIRTETADALTAMMENTVTLGTSARAFRGGQGRPFLPNIRVAGKTGTLSSTDSKQLYTWFVGFAPSNAPEVALAVLVVNQPSFRAKANVVARDILRAYFAGKGAPGVSAP